MAENADMILDGILDEYTGEYLGEGVGYPRSRYRRRRKSFNRFKYTKNKDLKGLRFFMSRFKYIIDTDHSDQMIEYYCYRDKVFGDINEMAEYIQKDFSRFKSFIIDQKSDY